MKLKIKKLNPEVMLPKYHHNGDAALDIYSNEEYEISPGEVHNFLSGFATEFPIDYVAKIHDRSSLANKNQIISLGGLIDSNYRGEWNITLKNIGSKPYKIEKGDKIAQVVFYQIPRVLVEETNSLSPSQRGDGWAGSTGK